MTDLKNYSQSSVRTLLAGTPLVINACLKAFIMAGGPEIKKFEMVLLFTRIW